MRTIGSILLLLACCLSATAQTTKVRGRVTDAETGEPIPFAGIFFKGTTVGQTTDLDGYYNLETRNADAHILVCQLLGYDVQEREIRHGGFTQADFQLHLTDNRLNSAFVKADNRLVKRLLANIDRHRARNDPEQRPHYGCDIYNKMELDLTHPKEQLRSKRFLRELGFVFDYMDTSSVSGVPYLPVMISESMVRRSHCLEPSSDSETIVANRMSGVNPDNNLLSQFTGSMHLKINFYKPFINSFDVEFPSPIQNSGLLFYNYYIIDSSHVDGRKTYLVRYHPKAGISSPAFDGEMLIDAEDFALKRIHAKMKRGGNVNWLRDVVIDSEYQRLEDSTWFYKQDKLYADFSVALGDSSKMMSVLGTRELSYHHPEFTPQPLVRNNGPVQVRDNPEAREEAYWERVRPYALTRKEQDIYQMVEAIKEQPLYQSLYSLVCTLINGYWDIGPIGLGPVFQAASFNKLEGFRPRIGIHTSKDFSQKFRLTGFLAYGTRDREFKGGLTWEQMFSKNPTRKLTVDAAYDVIQLGRGQSTVTDGNILASIWSGDRKPGAMSRFSALYQHEFVADFNMELSAAFKRYYANRLFVPMLDWAGNPVGTTSLHPLVGSVATNELHARFRFSREETVTRGFFIKTYLHTNHPVFTLDLTGSIPGLRPGDWGFFRPELTMEWKFRIPPAGMSQIYLNAGYIAGQVPWPLLHLHEGNVTNILDKSAFSCMEYFEFASDSWATLLWFHNFNGFFFGKVPLLSKLKLREEFTFKMAYGGLRNHNNGTEMDFGAPMRFPEGMRPMGKVPYIEIGAGISNIFQLLRIDCAWRLTHLEDKLPDGTTCQARRPFTVTAGMEFRF